MLGGPMTIGSTCTHIRSNLVCEMMTSFIITFGNITRNKADSLGYGRIPKYNREFSLSLQPYCECTAVAQGMWTYTVSFLFCQRNHRHDFFMSFRRYDRCDWWTRKHQSFRIRCVRHGCMMGWATWSLYTNSFNHGLKILPSSFYQATAPSACPGQ